LYALALLAMAPAMTSAKPILEPVEFSALKDWAADDHAAALAAFRRSCREIIDEGRAFERGAAYGGTRDEWIAVCRAAETATEPRVYFESNFTPLLVNDPARPAGLFTGYYEPEAEGSRVKLPGYDVPVYTKPGDLVALPPTAAYRYGRFIDGKPQAYLTRREIELGALAGKGLEIAWLKDWAEAFFIHIQGSGRVRLPDGSTMRLAYAGKSGQPFTGIGGVLIERGILAHKDVSMQGVRAWMKENPKEARELMWLNKSFIFFREVQVDDPNLGAPGAQYVNLTPQRSLAVDRAHWMFGTPIWLETTVPEPFHHLMVAQDTGTAIKGYVRGDVYWGWGEQAAWTAGHLKSPGRMVALLPKPLAERLLKAQ
jgi:membrane-bound lytic murein transglycosylase A